MCVDLEPSGGAEGKQHDHELAGLFRAMNHASQVVHISRSVDLNGIGEASDDRVVTDSPETR